MQLYVKLPRETIMLVVQPTSTIKQVKKQIRELKGIEVYNQILIFNDKSLDDKATVQAVGLTERGLWLMIPQISD
jgi:hypothetical protein